MTLTFGWEGEFSLEDIDAKLLVDGYLIQGEVNPVHLLEITTTVNKDIRTLNREIKESFTGVLKKVRANNANMYGGSHLIEDVSDITPKYYRTTSLSNKCARGFLDITGLQVITGIPHHMEEEGFKALDYFNRIKPAILALSASSPITLVDGRLVDTGNSSNRTFRYKKLLEQFPTSIYNIKNISSLEEYFTTLQEISDEVLHNLHSGTITDTNWDELTKIRDDGTSYYPFERLEPHQIYWPIRVRPDHANSESAYSLENRVSDMPTTFERIDMINNLITGLSYALITRDDINYEIPFDASQNEFEGAAKKGLNYIVKGKTLREHIPAIINTAEKGLRDNGFNVEAYQMKRTAENVLEYGNDADIIRKQGFNKPNELREFLTNRLYGKR